MIFLQLLTAFIIQLNLRNINIYFQLLAIITFLSFQRSITAQDIQIEKPYEIRFENNLKKLQDLYCWSDPEFFPGKFEFNKISDFKQEFEKIGLNIFEQPLQQSEQFYSFLESLPETDKQNFIKYFTYYENYFESVFQSYGLPAELKFMAPAVSAMNRNAAGPDGKAGIWQLTHFQGILNGLQINRLVDERLNEQLSTLSFAGVVKQNQTIYGSVELALLGQLLGNAKIQNAISFAENKKSLTDIVEFLPDSVSNTIAAFQATALFLSVNRFKEKVEPLAKKVMPDTVKINRQVHFKQVQEVLGIPEERMEFLNPQYRFSIVPGNVKLAKLVVPNGFFDDFVIWQDSIYSTFDSTLFNIVAQKIEYPPAPNRQYLGEPVKDLEIEGKTKIQYRLKTGDVLGIIAEKYDVRVADLKYWNNISNERRIQAGQKLDIFVDDDKVDYYAGLENETKIAENKQEDVVQRIQNSASLQVFEDLNAATKIEHVVKSGESPYIIAKEYEGVTPEKILEWNNIDDARKIQIGQKLIIYLSK